MVVGGSSSSKGAAAYTASDLTLQQRRANATTRQFQGFVKTLQAKLRHHKAKVKARKAKP